MAFSSLELFPVGAAVVTFLKSRTRIGVATVSSTVLRKTETKLILPVLATKRSASMRAVVMFLSPRRVEENTG